MAQSSSTQAFGIISLVVSTGHYSYRIKAISAQRFLSFLNISHCFTATPSPPFEVI
jgi:hypothetical protein